MTRTIITSNLICLTFLMGCSNYEDELLAKQEETYQSGRACLNMDTLHACKDFIKDFEEMSDIFKLHATEIVQKDRDGDEVCGQILLNSENLSKMGKAIAKN